MPEPPAPLPPSPVLAILFIVWCLAVGTLLMYAPWLPVWSRWIAPLTATPLHDVLSHPTVRGAVSGFGVYHLVWGTHDLDLLLGRFLRSRG